MSKVTYKTYLNDRLRKVSLHGHETHPLYVQVTYNRKTIFFKSYYFDLFSKPGYFVSVAGLSRGPSLEEIKAKEEEVIDFIINRHPDDFSLELFKKEYVFYSKDLCDSTEEAFVDYLYTFLQDKGMPAFAKTLKEGSRYCIAYDLVRDMKQALEKGIYEELLENAIYYAPPYLPLYGFMSEQKSWPMLSLSMMEWQREEMQVAFAEYLTKHYSEEWIREITFSLRGWLEDVKE